MTSTQAQSQADRARSFAALHQKGTPLVLYNIWDAGSARTLAKAGAQALATGSWSVAAAQGYDDGEQIPLDLLIRLLERITASTDLPVSLDVEGGYAIDPAPLAANIAKVIKAGAIGINFEDRIVQGKGLHDITEQAARIAAIRAQAQAQGVPLFINARTDLFLANPVDAHGAQMNQAITRAAAYAQAGASGFFVPGLTDPDLIAQIVAATDLPVNVMMSATQIPAGALAERGVARISHGPGPYRTAQQDLQQRFLAL